MGLRLSRREIHTTLDEDNNVDPDDGKSWICSACTLPIFSTPFKSLHSTNTADNSGSGGGGQFFLHDQCANDLPKELIGHVLHPREPLILKGNQTSTTNSSSCDNCNRKCGSMFYQCVDHQCCFRLDLLCALQIKILHRSHQHRLMVIRGALFICGACGSLHGLKPQPLSYLCNACGFWIHPDCASLPNAIILLRPKHHHHSLFLTYHLSRGSGSAAGSSKQAYTCAICKGAVRSLGVYFCAKCHYYAHIDCVKSYPQSFKPVLIRDAKFAGLLHFPMADECTSVMRRIIENNASGSDEANTKDDKHHQSQGKLFQENLHEHPLIFHDEDSGDQPEKSSHVCNACVQSISPPFYSCSQCPDFLLHSCCANLPNQINHPMHPEHTLSLFPKAPKSYTFGLFECKGCLCQCNGFAYSCNNCNFSMDVVCAILPPSITHESHGKTHILYMIHKKSLDGHECKCCNSYLLGFCYECSNCRHFKLHARCALLPSTINHKFDEHVLKLTTKPEKSVATDDSNKVQKFCEICEKEIQLSWRWYYSCSQCDQSFHIDCIPSVNDHYSRIKLGVTIHVNCHDCPLTLIPDSTVYGYRCGYCLKAFKYSPFVNPAYECSKCDFRIHHNCADKCLLKT